MKKITSLLCAAIISSVFAHAQNILPTIKGTDGLTKHFVRFDEETKPAFNLNNISGILGLNKESDLKLMNTEHDGLGFIHYRFSQTYHNVPIENAMYIVSTKNNNIEGLSGVIILDFTNLSGKSPVPHITESDAIKQAVAASGGRKYAWQDAGMEKSIQAINGKKASYAPEAVLVWYNPGEEINTAKMKLCYKVNVYSIEPLSRFDYFIDAQTGELTGKKDKLYFTDAVGTAQTAYSGAQVIHSDMTGANSFRLRDITKGAGIITLHGESGQRGNEYTNTSANWSLTGTSIAALDAHYGVSQTYSFYLSNFGRNSYNGSGAALYSYVNDPTYTDNAFWDGANMNFCPRANSSTSPGGTTGIDITGHELTHGVTQSTSNLNYSNESGAINESISDIMGKCVQFWSKPADINWQMSNDMGWIIRNMSNPNAQSQPDTYKGSFWYSGSADNGGVHTNSGVGNFMFFLLVNGGTGVNDKGLTYAVQCIGLAHAQQIIYRTETAYLTPTSNYTDWRTACINAATDLYGANSNDVMQVRNAWYAVGIGFPGDNISPNPLVCTSGVYSVSVTPGSTVAWTATPAGIVNLAPNGNQVTLTKITNGIITLRATVTNSCGTYNYYYTVGVGTPTPIVSVTLTCPEGTADASGVPNAAASFTWHLVDVNTHQEVINSNYGSVINYRNLIGTHNIGTEYTNACGTSLPGVVYNVYCPGGGGGGHFTGGSSSGNQSISADDATAESIYNKATISPNPARDYFIISNTDKQFSKGLLYIKIYDGSGRLVKTGTYVNNASQIKVSVTDILQGVYFINISDNISSVTEKLLITK